MAVSPISLWAILRLELKLPHLSAPVSASNLLGSRPGQTAAICAGVLGTAGVLDSRLVSIRCYYYSLPFSLTISSSSVVRFKIVSS